MAQPGALKDTVAQTFLSAPNLRGAGKADKNVCPTNIYFCRGC